MDKLQGLKEDISGKGKAIKDAKEDKISYPWVLYLTKGDKAKWVLFKNKYKKEFHVPVSKTKAFRAKAKAQVHLRGDVKVQYSLLRDYVSELQRCNPDTTVKIDVYVEEVPKKTTRIFRRIYVCVGALKRGFKEGGRELLENQYFWTWFLTCLANDFDMFSNSNFTFIIDRQKGLLPAIAKLFPSAEHTYYVRHINENMKLTWKGEDYKEMLWRAHCDLLINNLCEVFSRQLLDAMDSPIIIDLEFVKEYLMKRIVIVQKVIQKCDGPLTTVVTKLFNNIKEASSECTVDWNGSDLFQVKIPYQDQCVTNLTQKTCSCRKWEISGIPCKHAIAAIHDMADNGMDVGTLEEWVHESYKLQTWMNVYSHKVNPVNGKDMWSKFDCPTILLPPKVHPQIGRQPKRERKAKSNLWLVKPLGIEPMATQLVSSQPMARKSVARKFVARKPVQNKCAKKRAASKISNPANQAATVTSQDATQGSQAATQASRAPTIKRTKMSACRLTPDK
ncbi:mutator type transposase [Tanacetum coccineum]